MKNMLLAAIMVLMAISGSRAVFAQGEEPTIYVIQRGDTLWGLSERFLTDPFYWPNMWAGNQKITNPHFIFPGQKVRIFPDRIEVIETAPSLPAEKAATAASTPPGEQVAPAKTFMVSGSEGFLLEKDFDPAGFIVSTYQNRQMVGEDDIVYTDMGKDRGVKVGDRFSIFKKTEAISHPITNVILGYKVIPLGALQISETEAQASKAIVTKSFLEISSGSYLMPYRDRRHEVALKSGNKELTGYIVETQAGNKAIAAGDITYLDLGKAQGVEVGNMLYVVRDVYPDQKFLDVPIGKLPADVIGAVVVVEAANNTSSALVVKSIDTIYRGDRVEMKKNR